MGSRPKNVLRGVRQEDGVAYCLRQKDSCEEGTRAKGDKVENPCRLDARMGLAGSQLFHLKVSDCHSLRKSSGAAPETCPTSMSQEQLPTVRRL